MAFFQFHPVVSLMNMLVTVCKLSTYITETGTLQLFYELPIDESDHIMFETIGSL